MYSLTVGSDAKAQGEFVKSKDLDSTDYKYISNLNVENKEGNFIIACADNLELYEV